MDPLLLKVTHDFSACPSNLRLKQMHDFLINYPTEKFHKNKLLFFNAVFGEIRKISVISVDCVSELLFFLNHFKIEDGKLLCFVLEEISIFLQNYINKRSKEKITDDFKCLDLHLDLVLLKIFNIIFSHSNNEKIMLSIYSPSNMLLLGYVVAFLLFHCEYFKERELQNEALSSIYNIVDVDTEYKANIIVNFAPGIFQTLNRIISADRKIGFSVKTKAVKCLGRLIVSIYGDKFIGTNNDVINWEIFPQLRSLVVKRNEQWRSSSWKNVGKIIKIMKYSILERADEEHWRVKLQLLKLCISVLGNCSCVGEVCVDLIECCIVLTSDTDLTVKEQAKQCIDMIVKMEFAIPLYWNNKNENSSSILHSGSLLLASVIRNNLDKVIDTLQGLPTIPSDDIKCNLLQMVDGYLNIHELVEIISPSYIQIHKIMSHLVSICKVDHNLLDLLEPVHIATVDTLMYKDGYLSTQCHFFNKPFLSFTNDRVCTIIKCILSRLVVITAPHLLTAMLQSLVQDQPDDSIAIVLINKWLIEALISTNKVNNENKITLCKNVLLTYFDPEIMNIITTNIPNNNNNNNNNESNNFWKDDVIAIDSKLASLSKNTLIPSHSNDYKPSILKENTLILSIVMELCGTCCLCLRQIGIDDETDSWFMRICLFEVMNKSQQNPQLLSHSAIQCLHIISTIHKQYHCSLSNVIEINGDYIMDNISRRLRSTAIMLTTRSKNDSIVSKCHSACRSLITLCNHANEDIMPFLQTIINQVFYCLDETHGASNRLFMSVLKAIVKAICKWRNSSLLCQILSIKDIKLSDHNSTSSIEKIRQFLIERNEILISSGLRKDPKEEYIEILQDHSENELNFNNIEEEEPVKNEPASPITITIQNIVDRCINLMSNNNGQIRLSCLEILIDSLYALQTDQDTIQILVHQIWKPLEHRLWDKEFPIIIKAFDLLNTISQLCPNFLYVKIKDGFVNKLCVLLERCAIISSSVMATMKYTGIYRLQANLLLFISQLADRTGIHGIELEQIIDSFLIYLDDRQPIQLTKACETSLKLIFETDPSLVWYKLAQIQSSNNNEKFQNIFGHLARSYDEHYLINSEKLLQEINILHQ